jgi:dephospho-CoA kinase
MPPTIIGITGNKQHGKSTIANYLIDNFNYVELAFAKPLKDVCEILFDFDYEQLYGNKKEIIDERWKQTPRKLFEYIGTELFRKQIGEVLPEVNGEFWIKIIENKINTIIKNNENAKIVISDIRFQNELDFIKKLNYNVHTIKVIRPEKLENYTHDSEKNIQEFNTEYVFMNNGTIEDLYKIIDNNKNLF